MNSNAAIKLIFLKEDVTKLWRQKKCFYRNIKSNNPDADNLIDEHVHNKTMDQASKVMLLLKLYFSR